MNEDESTPDQPMSGVDLDPDELSPGALRGIVEEYVTREGTDYGAEEVALDVKVQQVLNRLKSGEAVLVYSELHESVDIKRKEDIEPSEAEEQ